MLIPIEKFKVEKHLVKRFINTYVSGICTYISENMLTLDQIVAWLILTNKYINFVPRTWQFKEDVSLWPKCPSLSSLNQTIINVPSVHYTLSKNLKKLIIPMVITVLKTHHSCEKPFHVNASKIHGKWSYKMEVSLLIVYCKYVLAEISTLIIKWPSMYVWVEVHF